MCPIDQRDKKRHWHRNAIALLLIKPSNSIELWSLMRWLPGIVFNSTKFNPVYIRLNVNVIVCAVLRNSSNRNSTHPSNVLSADHIFSRWNFNHVNSDNLYEEEASCFKNVKNKYRGLGRMLSVEFQGNTSIALSGPYQSQRTVEIVPNLSAKGKKTGQRSSTGRDVLALMEQRWWIFW